MANRQDLVICDNAHLSPDDCFHYCKPIFEANPMTDKTRSEVAEKLEKFSRGEIQLDAHHFSEFAALLRAASVQAEPTEARVDRAMEAYHNFPGRDEREAFRHALKAATIPAPGQVSEDEVERALTEFLHPYWKDTMPDHEIADYRHRMARALKAARMPAPVPSCVGVCAFDLDECTVTLAFDTEQQVRDFVQPLPGRRRIRLMDDIAPRATGETGNG